MLFPSKVEGVTIYGLGVSSAALDNGCFGAVLWIEGGRIEVQIAGDDPIAVYPLAMWLSSSGWRFELSMFRLEEKHHCVEVGGSKVPHNTG